MHIYNLLWCNIAEYFRENLEETVKLVHQEQQDREEMPAKMDQQAYKALKVQLDQVAKEVHQELKDQQDLE